MGQCVAIIIFVSIVAAIITGIVKLCVFLVMLVVGLICAFWWVPFVVAALYYGACYIYEAICHELDKAAIKASTRDGLKAIDYQFELTISAMNKLAE